MNERIKNLAEQAQKVVGYTDGGYTEIKALDQEKFAKLIIEECIDAISKDVRLNDVRSASNGCIRAINEHFGI